MVQDEGMGVLPIGVLVLEVQEGIQEGEQEEVVQIMLQPIKGEMLFFMEEDEGEGPFLLAIPIVKEEMDIKVLSLYVIKLGDFPCLIVPKN
ncbi:MAG: hypothetical protein LBD11_01145 [Candidatus Peribacteria bacterium]|nr:hypothetical protein [Candidatus Peribacteria bacterium]